MAILVSPAVVEGDHHGAIRAACRAPRGHRQARRMRPRDIRRPRGTASGPRTPSPRRRARAARRSALDGAASHCGRREWGRGASPPPAHSPRATRGATPRSRQGSAPATAPRSDQRTGRRIRIMRCTAGRIAVRARRQRHAIASELEEFKSTISTCRCARTQRPRSSVARQKRRVSGAARHGSCHRPASHASSESAPGPTIARTTSAAM